MGKSTPGPWIVFNMVHETRGDQMTPEEIGEYVASNVRKTREEGGFDHFLFVTTQEDGAPDICHIGNGPSGPYNARLIAAAPELLEHTKRFALTLEYYIRRDQNDGDTEGATLKSLTLAMVREIIAKAEGA